MITMCACLPLVLGANPDAPTPLAQCHQALMLAKLTEDDVFFDLGCGDGRMCILAAEKTGCKGVRVISHMHELAVTADRQGDDFYVY